MPDTMMAAPVALPMQLRGAPILPATLPARSEEAIAVMREHVLALPAPGPAAVRIRHIGNLSRQHRTIARPHVIK